MLWQEVTMHSQHLRRGELYSTFLRVKCLHKLFGMFLQGRFVSSSPFICSITCLYQYRRIDIYFKLWVITQYYFILLFKLFLLCPLRALSVGSYILLTHSHHCVFEHFFTFWHYKMLQTLVYSLTQA